MIDAKLLEILACPACQGDVTLQTEQQGRVIPTPPKAGEGSQYKIVCTRCGRKYPIKNGIPVLLVDQAEK